MINYWQPKTITDSIYEKKQCYCTVNTFVYESDCKRMLFDPWWCVAWKRIYLKVRYSDCKVLNLPIFMELVSCSSSAPFSLHFLSASTTHRKYLAQNEQYFVTASSADWLPPALKPFFLSKKFLRGFRYAYIWRKEMIILQLYRLDLLLGYSMFCASVFRGNYIFSEQ